MTDLSEQFEKLVEHVRDKGIMRFCPAGTSLVVGRAVELVVPEAPLSLRTVERMGMLSVTASGWYVEREAVAGVQSAHEGPAREVSLGVGLTWKEAYATDEKGNEATFTVAGINRDSIAVEQNNEEDWQRVGHLGQPPTYRQEANSLVEFPAGVDGRQFARLHFNAPLRDLQTREPVARLLLPYGHEPYDPFSSVLHLENIMEFLQRAN
jgi:hypothetical protein